MILMKNNKIVDSWSKVKPDNTADMRMRSTILAHNQMGRTSERKLYSMIKTFNQKRIAPIMASLAMIIALIGLFGNHAGWFSSKIYTAELDGGTLNFYKERVRGMAFDLGIDGIARDLTDEENKRLFGDVFGDYTISSHGFFSMDSKYGSDKTLLHVEARPMYDGERMDGSMKIILAATSLKYISDTIMNTKHTESKINDIHVSAGYWITKENSKGERNIIYLAAFEINEVQIYVECGGNYDKSEVWKEEVASAIHTITKNKTLDLSLITQ